MTEKTGFKGLVTLGVIFEAEDRGYVRGAAKRYHYIHDGDDAKVGDHALVLVNGGIDGLGITGHLKLVKVESVTKGVSEKATKCVVSIVKVAGYADRCKRIREIRELQEQLEARLEERRRERRYEDELAGDDIGMELLAKLRELEQAGASAK